MKPLRFIVTGWRHWSDTPAVWRSLAYTWRELSGEDLRQLVVVHGACPTGADAAAEQWAQAMKASGLPVSVERFHADWHRFGKAAGPMRNTTMVADGADVCLAFPGPARPDGQRSGTQDCMAKAEAAGIPVRTPAGVGS